MILNRLIRSPWISALLLALVFTFFHVPYLHHALDHFHADEAFNATLVLHTLSGGDPLPLILPGAPYQGSTELLWCGLFMKVLGPTVLAYKSAVFVLYLAFLIIAYQTLVLLTGRRGLSLAVMLLLAIGTPALHYYAWFSVGGHMTVTVLGTASIYLALKARHTPTPLKAVWIAAAAFFCGLAFYTYSLAVVYVLFFVAWGILQYGLRDILRNVFTQRLWQLGCASFLIGYSPKLLAYFVPASGYFPPAAPWCLVGPLGLLGNLSLLFIQILPLLLGVQAIAVLPAAVGWPDLLALLGILYTWVVLLAATRLIYQSWPVWRATVALERRKFTDHELMLLYFFMCLLVYVFTPNLHDVSSIRFVLPLLSVLPYTLYVGLDFVCSRLNQNKKLVLILGLVLYLAGLNYQTVAAQGLLNSFSTSREWELSHLTSDLQDCGARYVFVEYAALYTLEFLSHGHLKGVPFDREKRLLNYSSLCQTMLDAPAMQVAYVLKSGSKAQNAFAKTLEQQKIRHQSHTVGPWMVYQGLSKPLDFFMSYKQIE